MRRILTLVLLITTLSANAQIKTYEGYPLGVQMVVFSPDGRTLLMGSGQQSRTAHLFDLEKGEKTKELKGHPGAVTFGDWLPEADRFYTSAVGDSSIRIWSREGLVSTLNFGSCKYEGQLIIHKKGSIYAVGCDKKVHVFNSKLEKVMEVDLDEVYASAAISPNGKELVVGTALNELMFIDLRDGSIEKTILDDLGAKQFQYLSNDELMITDYYVFKTDEPYVRFINRRTGVETHFTDEDKILLSKYIPDKDLVFTVHSGGWAKLYDKSGKLLNNFGKIGAFPLSMDISNDGSMAAIGLLNRLVLIDLSKF